MLPMSENGRAVITTSVSVSDFRCIWSMKKITKMVSGTSTVRRALAPLEVGELAGPVDPVTGRDFDVVRHDIAGEIHVVGDADLLADVHEHETYQLAVLVPEGGLVRKRMSATWLKGIWAPSAVVTKARSSASMLSRYSRA